MRQRFIILLKLSPLLIPFAVIFSTGILLTILQSFGFFLPVRVEGRIFSAYRSLFSRSGYFPSLMYKLGVIREQSRFPSIIFGGNGLGIILAYVYKEVPFVMLLVTSVLKKFDFRRIETARMFGASKTRIFIQIVLPFLFPVLHTSFIILFLYSFGAFDIPYVIGESRPGMLSVQVYNLYFKRDLTNRPRAMAILVVMFLFSLFFIYLYSRVSRRLDVRSRKL